MGKNPRPVDVEVGRRVREQRLKLGKSQTALADAIGVTFQQVQKYERGFNRIGSSRLMQIANALQVPPAHFFQEARDRKRNKNAIDGIDVISKFVTDADALSLIRSFQNLKPKVRRIVVRFVQSVADNQ